MIELFVSIIGLFVLLLIIKGIIKREFCVLCASVCLTWIVFLVLFWIGRYDDVVGLAVLMGLSALGVHYTLEEKINESLLVFRLPILLTLIALVFMLLGESRWAVLWLVLVVWVGFLMVYVTRSVSGVRSVVTRLIECCKEW